MIEVNWESETFISNYALRCHELLSIIFYLLTTILPSLQQFPVFISYQLGLLHTVLDGLEEGGLYLA